MGAIAVAIESLYPFASVDIVTKSARLSPWGSEYMGCRPRYLRFLRESGNATLVPNYYHLVCLGARLSWNLPIKMLVVRLSLLSVVASLAQVLTPTRFL